jgi:spoIIIJ-associated protein
MSAPPLQVETTGETVGEAKWAALRELERLHPGLDKSAVRFQVVSEGERGLLGVGYAPARVIAVLEDAPEPVDESDDVREAREVVTAIVDALGVGCRVDAREDDDTVTVTCSGSDLGLLIGKHGQTIDAIQYLAGAIARRRPEAKHVVVDAAGYRARRRATLEAMAVRSAQEALRLNEPVALEPMTNADRKIVHLRLKDFRGVTTESAGAEPNRYVVIRPE